VQTIYKNLPRCLQGKKIIGVETCAHVYCFETKNKEMETSKEVFVHFFVGKLILFGRKFKIEQTIDHGW